MRAIGFGGNGFCGKKFSGRVTVRSYRAAPTGRKLRASEPLLQAGAANARLKRHPIVCRPLQINLGFRRLSVRAHCAGPRPDYR